MIQGELPMPIRLLILSLLVLCLAVSGCQQTQEPAVKVGVVDMNRLLRDSEPGKEASRFLEGMQKEIQQQAAQLVAAELAEAAAHRRAEDGLYDR